MVWEFKARRIFKCKACNGQFSVTSGTIFASRKMDLRDILAAIAIFANGAKGHSALQLSRDLDVQYKTAFVLSHKIREALAAEQRPVVIDTTAAVDGAYFGGYVKPANHKANRRDRRLPMNQTGKRQVVIVARELDGESRTHVAKSEAEGVPFVMATIQPGVTFTPTKPRTKPASSQSVSITRKPTALTAPARTWRSASSRASAAPRSAFTTTSPGRT